MKRGNAQVLKRTEKESGRFCAGREVMQAKKVGDSDSKKKGKHSGKARTHPVNLSEPPY